ncbi:MAG: hypothetical protein ACYDAC_09005 [Candidatus Dormibacteria bacterium]
MTVLLPDVEEAQRLAAALDEVRRPDGSLALIAVPPVRGLAFFADPERQEKLDRWWAHAIPRHCQPVYLLRHEPGIAPWLAGLDGRFVIGVGDARDAEAYEGLAHVTVARSHSALDIAVAAIDLFGDTTAFREDAVSRLQHRLSRVPPTSGPRFRRARLRPADEVFLRGVATAAAPHPIPNVPHPPAPPPHPEPGPDDLVRSLAETLRRLQRIRSGR